MKEYLDRINANDNNVGLINEVPSQDLNNSPLNPLLIEEINLLKQYVNDVSDLLRLLVYIFAIIKNFN